MNVTKIGMWIVVAAVAVLAGISPCRAATPESMVCSFHFRLGDDLLMTDYRGNKENFATLEQWMSQDSIARIASIRIVGAASPEGVLELNNQLSLRRAKAVRNYILGRWEISDEQNITVDRQTDYLSAWILEVESDPNVPCREKVLKILNSNASVQTKWANIQLLTCGASQYIKQHIFPQLRNAVSCIIMLKEPLSNEPLNVQLPIIPNAVDELGSAKLVEKPDTTNLIVDTPKIIGEQTVVADNKSVFAKKIGDSRKPLFAIKTNMLFDAATLLNLELEIPIGNRWSVAAEWICPWWLWEQKQHCLQVNSGNIEGKYWFGNRAKRAQLTGWHAGIYVGGGYYDLEWNKVGYQGEFFIAAGISGGYAHTINKSGNLRMEYSLGIGYMQTQYRKYDAEQDVNGDWHLYLNSNGRYTWTGPTRARISLVWMLNGKKRGGVAR